MLQKQISKVDNKTPKQKIYINVNIPHSNVYKRFDEHDIEDAIATDTRRREHNEIEHIQVWNTGTNNRPT